MRCPYCGNSDQKVLDSRPGADGESIRRRRECENCRRRFTTFERYEKPRLYVAKSDGTREEFLREKVFESMRLACRKRPVSVETIRKAVDRLERDFAAEYEDEVPTKEIGRRVMRELAGIDTVAYVRFASVYQEFATLADFVKAVDRVQKERTGQKDLQEALL